ncbi:hypothetical protein [Streptomyces rubiginosohelvolus]|uniref:hypothetical protein n=1 Tax=Streptomyces rubiginosohelvolus TaxID=67362 RepID=UPI00380CE138
MRVADWAGGIHEAGALPAFYPRSVEPVTATCPYKPAPFAAEPDGHGWAEPGPAAAPCEAARLIEHIVAAVRADDHPTIRTLLSWPTPPTPKPSCCCTAGLTKT